MSPRLRLTLGLAVAVCGFLAALVACRWLLPPRDRPVPWAMDGAWITAPGERAAVGYFRKTFELPGEVRTAWIAVAARDVSEISVNGSVIGSQTLWRPNRSFQFTTSERGQRVNDARPIPGVPYPREYQWEPQASYRVPVFLDLSRHLQPGRNALCIRVDSRRVDPLLRVAGQVLLVSGERLSLASDGSWKAATLPREESGAAWLETIYNDRGWTAAERRTGPEGFFRILDPAVFSEPFAGREITADASGAVTFATTWQLDEAPREAWLRLVVNRAYDLSINGRQVVPATLGPSELAAGSWIPRTLFATGQRWQPAALDPEDAGSLFAETAGDRSGTAAPAALLRDAQVGTFDACNVTTLLHRGENQITLRLVDRGAHFQWSPRIAVDGMARSAKTVTPLISSAATWTAATAAGPLPLAEARSRAADGRQLRYLGAAPAAASWPVLFIPIVAAFLLSTFATLLAPRLGPLTASRLAASLLVAAPVLASALIIDRCFAVREEALWMAQPGVWAAALLLATAAAAVTWLFLRGPAATFSRRRLAVHAGLVLVLIVCGFTRAYRADFQPTDADEWASLQTILAIVDTGTPRLTDEAYYTRSPLYHYLTAGSVVLFGETFWAVRLPGAAFAVATCALLYLCGARLLHSRWVGLGAAALFAIHPLAIDMGHQVRFYQQQQFFALLTFYYFCRGFVSGQRLSARYAMLAAFFAAVFSQEISVMMAFALLPAYLLYARGLEWRKEAGWLLAASCGLVFVVLDFVIFQAVCLTRLEGVSPRIEPALGLNFMFPSTLYWIFSLFSRLHLGLSLLFFAGLPFVLRSRNKAAITLVVTFFSGLVFTTILITGPGVRFQYWLFPLFFLTTVYGAQQLAAAALRHLRPLLAGQHRAVQWSLATVLVLMVALSWSPWKIVASYETKLLPDVDGAFAFVRQKIAQGDALAVAAPHTAAAMCELGRVDYDIELPLLHDFVYRKDGRLIDRNGGAQVIARVDDLQDALAQHDRVWVVLNRDIRFRSPGSRIAWQSPGARFDLFVRTNLQLVHQTYLTDVFLWDQSKGRLHGFRRAL